MKKRKVIAVRKTPEKPQYTLEELERQKVTMIHSIEVLRGSISELENDYSSKVSVVDEKIGKRNSSILKIENEIEQLREKISKEKEHILKLEKEKRDLRGEMNIKTEKVRAQLADYVSGNDVLDRHIENAKQYEEYIEKRKKREAEMIIESSSMAEMSGNKKFDTQPRDNRNFFPPPGARQNVNDRYQRNRGGGGSRPNNEVFIRNLPQGATKLLIQDMMKEIGFDVPQRSIKIKQRKYSSFASPVYAFVTMDSIEAATALIRSSHNLKMKRGHDPIVFQYARGSKQYNNHPHRPDEKFWVVGGGRGGNNTGNQHQRVPRVNHEKSRGYDLPRSVGSLRQRRFEDDFEVDHEDGEVQIVYNVKKKKKEKEEEYEGEEEIEEKKKKKKQVHNSMKRERDSYDDLYGGMTEKYQKKRTNFIDWDTPKHSYNMGAYTTVDRIQLIQLVFEYGSRFDWERIGEITNRRKELIRKYYEEQIQFKSKGFADFWSDNNNSNQKRLIRIRIQRENGIEEEEGIGVDMHLLRSKETIHLFWMYMILLNGEPSCERQKFGYVIVGKGNHSRDGISRLFRIVTNTLERKPLNIKTWGRARGNSGIIVFPKKAMKN